jgi:diguanylate cyclase (GGDEF)-like protein/PAS domain S-box-containing protein
VAANGKENSPGARSDATNVGATQPKPAEDAGTPLAVVAVVVALAASVGMGMIHAGVVTALWPANGILLAFLLTASRRRWAGYLAAGLLANVAVHAFAGLDLWTSLQISIANTIEILTAAWPFRKIAPRRPELTDPATLLRFALLSGLLAPLISGLYLIAATPRFLDAIPVMLKLRLWYVADCLGILLFTPLLLAMLSPELARVFIGKRLAETTGLLSALTLTAVFVFHNESFPFPFVVLVVLIPVIFRLGLAASAVGVLLIAIPAIYYTFAGHGPLARSGVLYWSLFLQVYFIILLATVYVVSAVRGEEKRLADELRSSETRYRVLAETSQDLILRTTLDGARTYVSPSIRLVIGWTEEELPPPEEFAILVHPADRSKFAAFLAKVRAEPGSHTLVFRVRRRDGTYGWLEAYLGTVFAATGVPDELVWTIRDVSPRVEHEESLKSEKLHAEELAWIDALTGIGNRRAFDQRLAAEWALARQRRHPLSLLMLDVDNFKSYNDAYGHQSGDECLRQIAQVIADCTRHSGDLAARYGGEEFAVVLRGADMALAEELAELIRAGVRELRLEHRQSPIGQVTVSIGVSSTSRAEHAAAAALLASADEALYLAKRGGRNRVVLAA